MTGDSSDESLSWVVRPYEDAPQKRWVVFGAALLALLAGVFLIRIPLLGLLGFGMILASTMDYWLGSSFRVDARGARSRTGASVTEIEWPAVKRAIVEDNGVKLSPLEPGSKLEQFRGVFLRFGKNNREQILEAVRKFGEGHVRSLED
jgi:hypothetical protein